MTRFCEAFRARHQVGLARVTAFLLRRDTALIEFLLGVSALLNAWQVTTLDSTGHSVAPFLDSAISYLIVPKIYWVLVLLVVGSLKLLALTHGLIHNNFYLIRARVSFWASLMWSGIAFSIMTSHEAPVTGARYLLWWFLSILTYWILHVKHRDAMARKRAAMSAMPREHSHLRKLQGGAGGKREAPCVH